MRLFMVVSLGAIWIITNNDEAGVTEDRDPAAAGAEPCISHTGRGGLSTGLSAAAQPCTCTVAAAMRLPTKTPPSKNSATTSPWRRLVARRVLGLALVLAGLSMLLTGVETMFFH